MDSLESTKKLSLAMKSRLCTNAESNAPSQCYTLLEKMIKNTESLISFCSFTLSVSKSSGQVEFNKDFKLPVAAAECVLKAPSKVDEETKLELCLGARSVAPGQCFSKAVASQVPSAFRVRLCQGSLYPTAPVECYDVTTADIVGDDKIKLCTLAASDAPARCAQRIVSRYMRPEEKVMLCEGATDEWPALCANAMPRQGVVSEMEVAQLCNRAVSLDPGQCFLSAPPTFTALNKIALCHTVRQAQHVIKCASALTSVTVSQRIAICSQATSSLVVDCMVQGVPHSWPLNIKISFCAAIRSRGAFLCLNNLPPRLTPKQESELCHNALSTGPVDCMQAMPSRYTDEQVVSMCTEAESDVPARCAREAGSRVAAHLVAVACRQALSPTPGQCLNAQSSFSPSASVVDECQNAVAIPDKVVVIDGFQTNVSILERPGGTVVVAPQLVVVVKNQYGARMMDQRTLPKLYASVDKGREMGASLVGLKSVAADKEGRYRFAPIEMRCKVGGVYWIRVGGPSIKPARAPFRVRMNVVLNSCADRMTGCDAIYHQLMSPLTTPIAEEMASPSSSGRSPQTSSYEAILGAAWTLPAIACMDHLASDETGVVHDYSSGMTKVSILPRGLGRLKAQLDIPTPEMTAYDRLDLPENTSDVRAIKRAYRNKALEWHPDKWITAAMDLPCGDRISEIFGLVIDAYNQVSGDVDLTE